MIQSTHNEQISKIANWIAIRLEKYEVILALLFLGSLILKSFTQVPVNIIIVLSLMSLAILYFFSGFSSINDENVDGFEIFLNKLSFWGCSVGIIGILFRIECWAGYETMIRVGCFTIAIVLPFIIYIKSKKREMKHFNLRYILRIIVICIIGFFLAFASNDVLIKYKIIEIPKNEIVK